MELLLFAFLSAQGIIVLLWKIGFARVLRHELLTDVLATVGLGALFMGTYSGMVVGLIAGLIVSLELRLIAFLGGYYKVKTPRRWWFDNVTVIRR